MSRRGSIVGETSSWLRYHAGYRCAERWLNEEAGLQERGVLEVIHPTVQLEAGGRRPVSRLADEDRSKIDAVSRHTVQAGRDIDGMFAFDSHLSLYGASVVPEHAERRQPHQVV